MHNNKKKKKRGNPTRPESSMSLQVFHHALLQYLLAQRLESEENVAAFHKTVLTALGVDEREPSAALATVVSVLNGGLEACGLRIATILDDEVGRRDDADDDRGREAAAAAVVSTFYAVINLHADEAAKFGTEYKAKELSYFRQLVDMLITDLSCSLVAALNAADGVDGFSKANAEATLKRLVADRWLFCSARGDYSLGVRSALELVPYIEQRFGADALPTCTICQAAVLNGIQCPTAQCKVRVHNHCALQWFGPKDVSCCLVCQAPWTAALPPHIRRQIDAVRQQRLNIRRDFRGVVLN